MRAYLCMISVEAPGLVEVAENKREIQIDGPLDIARIYAVLGDPGVATSRRMYYALVLGLKGPALVTIKGVEQYNGALAWRALTKRYAPSTGQQSQSLLHSILNTKPLKNVLTDYETGVAELEELMRRYEQASGELLQESLKKDSVWGDRADFMQNSVSHARFHNVR